LLRFLLAVVAAQCLVAAAPNHKLVVISIGGLDARFLNEPVLKVKAPNIRKLMKEGASATVVGVAPSASWPSHASLVTGVSPWQNGITVPDLPAKPGDQFFSSSAIRTATLWGVASAAGLKTASVFWPSTVGGQIAFDLPEYWETRRNNAVPMEGVISKSSPPGIGDRIAKRFPAFQKELWDDTSSSDAALYLLSAEQPDVLFVHFADVESEQHETTALSIYAREILENDDDLIGQILKSIPPGTVVALVSGHGFENSNRVVRPRVLLRQAGVKGNVEIAYGLIGTTDPAVAGALRKIAAQGRKSGIAREVKMSDVKARVPALGRWVAAFDTVPDCIASNEERGAGVGTGPHAGTDGLWPTRPNYRSILILNGTSVKPVKLGEVDMLQIAPTLADILGVKLPAAKSQSLWKTVSR
jgi:predicted AlkP superfamily pyrophosphatase or phosphodiesterase